jgi:SAM-dependent methyltransferase
VFAPHHGLSTDQHYLRESQYKDPSNLNVRIALHAKYSRSDEPWFQWLAARVDWPEGADVLEAGCGSGNLWANIGPLLPHIRLTLTDLSEGMVEAARQIVAPFENVELAAALACDVQDLPFDDDAFDVVVANHMLYHVPDAARATAEFARVLRPGGVLLAATNGPNHLLELREMSREAIGWSGLDYTDDRFGRSTGESILRRAFDDVAWLEHPNTMVVTDPDDIVAFILSSAAGDVATPEQQGRLPQVVRARFDEEGGAVLMTTEAGCFVARGPRPRTDGWLALD